MELKDLFLANPLRLLLVEARKQSKRLALHITGLGMKTAIETMDEFETEQKKNLRQKYSRSNVDIFTRLHRPIDKVFSASGGSMNINLPESKQKEFNVYLGSVRKGMSLRKWVQQIALKAYEVDPNSVIFMEVDADGVPYPTYKSTDDIFYYKTKGREVELLILNLSLAQAEAYGLDVPKESQILFKQKIDRVRETKGQTKFYRVVDAVSDKIVEWDGKVMTEVPELNLPNPFTRCPAILTSDIYQFNSDLLLSPDSEVVELANSLLTQNSVFEIWKNLHMFPKHWRMRSVCPSCMGNGVIAGNTCTDCGGTKFQKRSSVRDEIIVPFPDTADGKITLPAAFDGYTTPSVEAWTLSTNDLDRLYNQMFETMWGYSQAGKAPTVKTNPNDKTKTATQVMDESNGKVQRLYCYSEWAESIEKFVIDLAAEFLYGSAYKGCSVNYGDRYIMEGPDEIWIKYSEARQDGSAQAVLDDLLRDYYESKNYGNPLGLQRALKQMRVEPWVHLTMEQVEKLTAVDLDKTCKMYFSEWASTLKDMDWIQNDDKTLRDQLVAYCTPKAAGVVTQTNAKLDAEAKAKAAAKPVPAAA